MAKVVNVVAEQKKMDTLLQWLLGVLLLLGGTLSYDEQLVEEDLFISHLPDAHVMAHLEFKTSWRIHPRLFPQRNRGKLYTNVIDICSV